MIKKIGLIISVIIFVLTFLLLFFIYQFNNKLPVKQSISINIQNTYSPQTPSLETIFSDNHSWIATLSAEKITTLIATGDVIPARSVNFQTVKRNDFKWPFEKTADVLRNADLTVVNLESPLVSNCPLTNEGMIFCSDPRHIEGFIFAGVDVANLANNHSQNYGEKWLKNTAIFLNKNNIISVGINDPVIKEFKNKQFAFLGFNALVNLDKSIFTEKISQARKYADLVIIMFHWGIEYTDRPSSEQIELAHLAIDLGADLVLGNHPHWIQPVEIYKDKFIIYAHGNFIFDQMWSEETKKGVIGRYIFYDNKLIDVQFLPIVIENYGQPYFAQEEKKKEILNSMKTTSQEFLAITN